MSNFVYGPKPALRAALGRKVRQAGALPAVLKMSGAIDSCMTPVLRMVHGGARPAAAADHVVLPTYGSGNIGDQALLESYLASTSGRVSVLVHSSDAFTLPAQFADRVEFVIVKGLVQSRLWYRPGARSRFAALVFGAKSFTVIGADVMDGGYGRRESVVRSHLLTFASKFGVPCRLVSFSWNGNPEKQALSALMRASRTADLFVRDPISMERLRTRGMSHLHESSDIVFGHTGKDPIDSLSGWLEEPAHRRFVIVNVSGLIGIGSGKLDDYVTIVDWLLEREYAVVLLPHVIRSGDDDLQAVERLAARFTDSRVHVARGSLSPSNVAWLVGQAQAILTGRMHLAVLGFKEGTPSAVYGTQGKVEGMLSLTGLDDFLLTPAPGMAEPTCAALAALLSNPSIRSDMRERLPAVLELARLPMAGLGRPASLASR